MSTKHTEALMERDGCEECLSCDWHNSWEETGGIGQPHITMHECTAENDKDCPRLEGMSLVSDCCGEHLVGSDEDPICSACKEHCEAISN